MTAYTDYASLKTDVESWMARDDFPTTIYGLATRQINKLLRVREMVTAYSATVSSEAVALPSAFIEWDYLYVDRNPRVVLSASDGYSQDLGYDNSGIPTQYRISGSNMYLNPTPDAAYDLAGTYYAKLTEFSADADTNDVLTTYPEVYLAACLMVAHAWDQDAEQEMKWAARFQGAVTEANDEDLMSRFSGQLKMRPRAYA